jgi:hypothetical protein
MVDCIAKLAPLGRSVPAGRLIISSTPNAPTCDLQDTFHERMLVSLALGTYLSSLTHISPESLDLHCQQMKQRLGYTHIARNLVIFRLYRISLVFVSRLGYPPYEEEELRRMG